MDKYYGIVIGFGKGGKLIASSLASKGYKVALIEKDHLMYGGTCINVGCIPTKTLIDFAHTAHKSGISQSDKKSEFFEMAMEYKNNLRKKLNAANYTRLAALPNVTIIEGTASFTGPNTIKVTNKENAVLELSAEYFFIDTGAKPILPDIPGIDGKHIYTSAQILDVENLPSKLVIMGGGYVGLEFASMFASFGSEVTVLETNHKLLPKEDRDIANSVVGGLASLGIKFITGAYVKSFESTEKHVTVHFDSAQPEASIANAEGDLGMGAELQYESAWNTTITADAVLIATGRLPNTSDLNLQAANIKTDPKGAIIVNDTLLTSNPAVYALGDVKGGLQFTYISMDDWRIIINHLEGKRGHGTSERGYIPYSVFLNPPLSRVGIDEDQAIESKLDYVVTTLSMNTFPKALTLNEGVGMMKAIIEKDTNKILGCALYCADSPELINLVTMAMNHGITADELENAIYTHPSMTEAFNDLF